MHVAQVTETWFHYIVFELGNIIFLVLASRGLVGECGYFWESELGSWGWGWIGCGVWRLEEKY